MILGSAAVGSLSFAFSDSFWFNAVEAEVYAMATFIMSVCILFSTAMGKRYEYAEGRQMGHFNRICNRPILWSSLYGAFNNSCYGNVIFL